MQRARMTWTLGGAGLVLCGVLGMLWSADPSIVTSPAIGVVIDLVYAVAVLLFAIGLSREGSVVARRPLGLTALAVVALWPLVSRAIDALLPMPEAMTFDPARSTLVSLDLLVTLAAAIVAVVRIGRAGVVPRPWRWAPLWALGVSAATWIIPQVLFVAAGPSAAQYLVGPMTLLGTIGFLVRTLGLGILALVLAARDRRGTVEVYRST